jgi:hypothetical protein
VVPKRTGRIAGTRAAIDSMIAAYFRRVLVDAEGRRLTSPTIATTPSTVMPRSRSPAIPVIF